MSARWFLAGIAVTSTALIVFAWRVLMAPMRWW